MAALAARATLRARRILAAGASCLVAACAPAPAAPSAPPSAAAAAYDPSRDLGPLFHDVQTAGIFADSKTFVDARPLDEPRAIATRYLRERRAAGFDLRAFVSRWFEPPRAAGAGAPIDTSASMEAHIRALWPALTRPPDAPDPRSSRVPLPNAYVVPGGRFREVYYWDSYFTMLGLVRSGREDLVRGMLDNFAHLVRTTGHVPNGNRTYYLSRSQPPFFAAMVSLYAESVDSAAALRWLDALEAEHAFWMDGADHIAPGQAYRRVVRLPDGSILNRYWDDRAEPRPESYREDYAIGHTVPAARREVFFRNVRASAESGWDFSSRWMRDPRDLRTLETTELAPIDLNALLFHAEHTIAWLRRHRGQPGDAEVAARYERAAGERRRALLAAAWDSADGFFYDVRWRTGERVRDRPTLAAVVPLYFGLAAEAQGRAVADRLEREFLKPGGFVTTNVRSGQQWDAPNGWPPLEWMATEGARRYYRFHLADEARTRWLALVERTYRSTGRMMEKYDVVDSARPAGGGEYPTQDGFGWTNGVVLALLAQPGVLGLVPWQTNCQCTAPTLVEGGDAKTAGDGGDGNRPGAGPGSAGGGAGRPADADRRPRYAGKRKVGGEPGGHRLADEHRPALPGAAGRRQLRRGRPHPAQGGGTLRGRRPDRGAAAVGGQHRGGRDQVALRGPGQRLPGGCVDLSAAGDGPARRAGVHPSGGSVA